MSKNDRKTQASGRERSQRGFYLYLAVLFVTACWAAILYFGGRAIGVPIATGWLVVFAGAIFVLLLLGLGMAAVASGGAGDDDWAPKFHPQARPIALFYHPQRQTPWAPAGHQELRLPVEQSGVQDG